MRSIGASTSSTTLVTIAALGPVLVARMPAANAFGGNTRNDDTSEIPKTVEGRARYAEQAIWEAAQVLRKIKISAIGGSLPHGATQMEFSGDLPPNRNLIKTRALPYKERTALESSGLSEAETKAAGLVLDDREANEDLINERLNNRDDLAKLPSAWTSEGNKWWRRVETTKIYSNCLTVQFMEIYRQAVNFHHRGLPGREGGSVDFDRIWRRMVLHKQHKVETIHDLTCLTGVVFPTFGPHGNRAEKINTYLNKPPLMDWVRHPTLLMQQVADAAPRNKSDSSWRNLLTRKQQNSVKISDQLIDLYEEEAAYYNLFSWRFTHLRGQAFDFFSEAEITNTMDFGSDFKGLPLVEHTNKHKGVTDLSSLKGGEVDSAAITAIEKYLEELRVEQNVFALLSRTMFGDETGKNAVVTQMFDTQKLPALKAAQDVVKQWYLSKLPLDASVAGTFALRWSVSRAIHKWFETVYVPAVCRAEPALATVQLPLDEVTPGDRSVACIVDMMYRMDTNDAAALVAKYYCNEPNPISKSGGKQQSSRYKYRGHLPTAKDSLIKPYNVKSTTDDAYDHFNESPAFHAAFHVKEQDETSRVVLPGYQELYTRYDEILTSQSRRAFHGHTAHFGLDKTAKDESSVFSLYTISDARINAIEQSAVSLVYGLKHGSLSRSRGDMDDPDVMDVTADDEDLASEEIEASFRRHPLLKELQSISKLTDPYIKFGLVSKGIYEILGHGFYLSGVPEHMKVHRKQKAVMGAKKAEDKY